MLVVEAGRSQVPVRDGARKTVDLAMDVSGGSGMFTSNELECLYRDVRRGGPCSGERGLPHLGHQLTEGAQRRSRVLVAMDDQVHRSPQVDIT
jgi:hypothetical protein